MVSASSSCLVTADPDFARPEQTAPLLIASDQNPQTEFLRIQPNTNRVSLVAHVVSEDEGEQVNAFLLVDYGQENQAGDPYLAKADVTPVPAGTIAEGRRDIKVEWFPSVVGNLPLGCHSITLVASHQFRGEPPFGCPVDLNDYSTLTWFVASCPDDLELCRYDDCPIHDTTQLNYCFSEPPGAVQ